MANRKECVTPSARTPGPWTARTNMSGVTICNPEGVAVAKTPCCDRQAVADGALLAAAPDLLDALRLALEAMESEVEEVEFSSSFAAIRAAIAAAEALPS